EDAKNEHKSIMVVPLKKWNGSHVIVYEKCHIQETVRVPISQTLNERTYNPNLTDEYISWCMYNFPKTSIVYALNPCYVYDKMALMFPLNTHYFPFAKYQNRDCRDNESEATFKQMCKYIHPRVTKALITEKQFEKAKTI